MYLHCDRNFRDFGNDKQQLSLYVTQFKAWVTSTWKEERGVGTEKNFQLPDADATVQHLAHEYAVTIDVHLVFSPAGKRAKSIKKQLQQQRQYIKLNDTSGICLKPKCFIFELRPLLNAAVVR